MVDAWVPFVLCLSLGVPKDSISSTCSAHVSTIIGGSGLGETANARGFCMVYILDSRTVLIPLDRVRLKLLHTCVFSK
ncbi:hypothetical protein RSAG8_01020, partial [Rhizoctonia solani AG-8 WAC10335]